MTVYKISPAAESDWQDIANYTLDNHGKEQLTKYTNRLLKCIKHMNNKQNIHKDKRIAHHKIRIKHCQKHYIFAIIKDNSPMVIIAIFHEKMQLMARLKNRLNNLHIQ